jgi:MFS family permease
MNSVPAGFVATVRALPRPAWILFIGTFVNRFGTFVGVFLVLYLTRIGYSIPEAGVAVAFYGAGGIPASGLGGYFADRFGRRDTLAYSSFATAAATMGLAYARGLPAILLLSFLVGLFGNMFRPPVQALLADVTSDSDRVVAMGVMRFFINAGFAAGPAVAGFLADRAYILGFIFDAGTSAIFGLIALAYLPRGAPKPDGHEVRAEGTRAILADRGFLIFLLASFLVSLVYMQSYATLPLWVRANGYSNAVYGILIGLNGFVIILVELLIISFTRRLPTRPTMAVGFLLVGLGFALTAPAHTIPLLAITVLVWSLGEMVATPMASAHVANVAPRHLRGRYAGAWSLTWALGITVGSVAGTWVFARSTTLLWLGCGAICVVSAVLVLFSETQDKSGEASWTEPSPASIQPGL